MPLSDTNFVILDVVHSTNNYAMENVHARMAKHGKAYFSTNQIAGKGQRGKVWEAEKGQNIALSIVLEPKVLSIAQQFRLSTIVSLACFNFLSKYAGEETSIKWPNDIYWRDRKAGGVLIENILHGNNWSFSVVGIGININQTAFDPALPNPVSLKQITGKTFDPVELGKELYIAVMEQFSLLTTVPFNELLNKYNQHLYCRDKQVFLKKEEAVFETIIKGVAENGQLITFDTMESRFDFGEVEWVLVPENNRLV